MQTDGAVCALDEGYCCGAVGEGGKRVGDEGGETEEDAREQERGVDVGIDPGEGGVELVDPCCGWRGG